MSGSLQVGTASYAKVPVLRAGMMIPSAETPGAGPEVGSAGDGLAEACDKSSVGHLVRDADRIQDRPRRGRPVADDAHAVDPEQHRPPGLLRIDMRRVGEQLRQQ